MEIKYEAVFGDQALFDGVPEYIEFIRFNDYSREYLWGDSNSINHLTFKDLKAIPIVAMRRIIKEPKRWTWEDKKAGKLPEVGCVVMVTSVDECASVAAINNDAVCVVFNDGEFTTLHKSVISPIESPEEKAARLREEWLNKSLIVFEEEGLIGLHDALLSGDLPVPVKEQL